MLRLTKPEKWKDTFFLNLSPIQKLIFIYLYENCDDAGFFDINFHRISVEVGVPEIEVSTAFKIIEKSFLVSESSERIWIRKFLLHQNRLPLDLKTAEGNFIKYQLESNLTKFGYAKEMQDIAKNVKRGKAKTKNEFEKPSLDEIIDFFKTGEWNFISRDEISSIYDYYDSVGWKVGNKKMVDWKKAFLGCFRRNISRRSRPNFQQQKQTRMDVLVEENKKIENFDYSSLTKGR